MRMQDNREIPIVKFQRFLVREGQGLKKSRKGRIFENVNFDQFMINIYHFMIIFVFLNIRFNFYVKRYTIIRL